MPRKANSSFMQPLVPSDDLAVIVGARPLPRTEAVKKMWAYIKRHKLQDDNNRRMILADDKLYPLFGKKSVSMFELTSIISANLFK